MGGIAGIISPGSCGKRCEQAVRRMISTIGDQSAEHTRFYIHSELGVYLAWHGAESMCSAPLLLAGPGGQTLAVLLGEAFLSTAGSDQCAADSVIRLLEERGIEGLQELGGTFTGVLLDVSNRRVVVFNDRYGLGRLYYQPRD